jgi:hypothetical protein
MRKITRYSRLGLIARSVLPVLFTGIRANESGHQYRIPEPLRIACFA